MMWSKIIFILLMMVGHFNGVVVAQERPWGVVTPFGSVMTDQRGFQGRYNPWESEISEGLNEAPVQSQKRIRQGWQNIYRLRPSDEEEIWPDAGKSPGKAEGKAQKRMFGDNSLTGEEQWPERSDSRTPYRPNHPNYSGRPIDRFGTPFGTFSPSMPRQPFTPYGGYYPSWQRY